MKISLNTIAAKLHFILVYWGNVIYCLLLCLFMRDYPTIIIPVIGMMVFTNYRSYLLTQCPDQVMGDMVRMLGVPAGTAINYNIINWKCITKVAILPIGDTVFAGVIPGFGVVCTAAVDRLSVPQVEALMSHEVCHLIHNDIHNRNYVAMLLNVAAIGVGIVMTYIGVAWGWAMVTGYILSCLYIGYLHHMEYRADMATVEDGLGKEMIDLLEHHIPDSKMDTTHPMNAKRIRAIQKAITN